MKTLLIALLVPFALLAGGCGTCKHSTDKAPFSIDLSSGGGFSGMHTGFTLKSDGTVLYWRGMYGRREEVRPLGTADADAVRTLKALIDERKLSSFSHRETGNMTTALAVTEGELLYTITWPGMDSESDNAPGEVKPVLLELQRLLGPFRDKALQR